MGVTLRSMLPGIDFEEFSQFSLDDVVDHDGWTVNTPEVADDYFGPGAWSYIFAEDAHVVDHTTRSTVIKAITKFVKQNYGCTSDGYFPAQ